MALMELVELVVDEALLDPQVKEGDEGGGAWKVTLYYAYSPFKLHLKESRFKLILTYANDCFWPPKN